MWQIIVQIETHVKYEISAHVKGQNTADMVLLAEEMQSYVWM